MKEVEKEYSVQLYRALHRPQLLLGGEREPVLFLNLIVGILTFGCMNLIATAIGISIWFIGMLGLRKMAKKDYRMSKIYLRRLKYQRYYPARSSPFEKKRFQSFY